MIVRVITVVVTIGALVCAVPHGRAAADVMDCEAARCAAREAISQQCPCETATRHGRYVSCVAHVLRDLARSGAVPRECTGRIVRCAARSTCGRAGVVTCHVPSVGTCDLATGTCAHDATVPCAADADCTVRATCRRITLERCAALGGSVSAGASCCGECAAAPL
jgi:hypothetical protein